MKKAFIAIAAISIAFTSCNKAHDCVCSMEETTTKNGTTETEKSSAKVTLHDQKDDCSSFNETETSYYTDYDYDYTTFKSTEVEVKEVEVTTCVED